MNYTDPKSEVTVFPWGGFLSQERRLKCMYTMAKEAEPGEKVLGVWESI